jgi:primosomal protein N'
MNSENAIKTEKSVNLITVIPLTKSRAIDTLTYFATSNIELGSLVTVPVRNKDTSAIVIETKSVIDIKSELKSADYTIKKLGKVKSTTFFKKEFLKACESIANYYATTLGSIIRTMTSLSVLENASMLKTAPILSGASSNKGLDETFAIQGDDPDRLSAWKSLIRQEFAQKKSIIIYVPSYEEINNMMASLSKGVEDYIFTLHGDMTEKKIIETWNKIAEEEHPVVIVATSIFTNIPRNDVNTIIIERENSRGWLTMKSPFIDMRKALETIYRKQGKAVYIADSLLRSITLARVENHEIATGSPFKWKSISTAKDEIIDMKAGIESSVLLKNESSGESMNESGKESGKESKKESRKEKRHFRVLSDALESLIRTNHENNTHLFIMTSKRGLSSITVCDDCETIVSCKECGAPVVLHISKENSRNFFMCHNCGSRRAADESCANCTGWRLTPLGIGTDRVVEEVRKILPESKIAVIDADATKTEKQIRNAVATFYSQPGCILVGTELALLHIHEQIENIGVASIDSMLSLPDFSIQERIMYLLTRLRSLAKQNFIIQTRRIEEKVFEYGSKGNLGDFYRNEIKDRKQYSYPPFSTLIKISIEGKKDSISSEMSAIKELVLPQTLDVFPAFTAAQKGNSSIHGLIKIPSTSWPDKTLQDKLNMMPQHVSVKIDPENLL